MEAVLTISFELFLMQHHKDHILRTTNAYLNRFSYNSTHLTKDDIRHNRCHWYIGGSSICLGVFDFHHLWYYTIIINC